MNVQQIKMDVQTVSGLLVIFLQFGLYRHSTPTKHTHTHAHTHTHTFISIYRHAMLSALLLVRGDNVTDRQTESSNV